MWAPASSSSEQVKGTLIHVRPVGEVRLPVASWGRETVGTAVVGSVYDRHPRELLEWVERQLTAGVAAQLPREVEALHKFQLGADPAETAVLIDSNERPHEIADLEPLRPLSHLSLFENPLGDEDVAALAADAAQAPWNYRYVRHPSGDGLIFDRRRSHVLLVRDAEWKRHPAFGRWRSS